MNKKPFTFLLILILAVAAGFINAAYAKKEYTPAFNDMYGTSGVENGTTLGSCITCHNQADGKGGYNPYGIAYLVSAHNFIALELNDSDGDTFDNITEIDAGSFPGDSSSIPDPVSTNEPPVADAGPNQNVDEGIKVDLNGSNSSDPDGGDGIASYLWMQIEGPAVSLSDPASSEPSFISPDVGPEGEALIFQLTVTDKSGEESTATCIVNVSWINEAPTADAGPGQTVKEGSKVDLDGTNSSDPDDGIASYQWRQLDGISVSLSDANAVQTSFTAPDVGPHGAALNFELTVTDSGGLKSMDTIIVNVGWVNAVPTVDAGPDQTVNAGDEVTLDGSGSEDPENGITGYLWTQLAGPAVTLSDPTAIDPMFTAPDAGTEGAALTFQLTITDNGDLQVTDTCIVNIAADVNLPPVADAGPDQTVNAGAPVNLDGSKSSDPDNGDGIADYLWTQLSGPAVTLSDATAIKPTFLAPDVGPDGAAVSFELTVTDLGGLKSTNTIIVNVAPVEVPPTNQPPIADAGPDQTVNEGDPVTLDGSKSSDPDDGDGIAGFLWKQIAGPQVKLLNPPPDKPTFTAPEVGKDRTLLTFQLTVTDKAGQQGTDTCTVTVMPVDEPPATEPLPVEEILSEIQDLIQDSSIPENMRKQLEKADGLLREAVEYFQREMTYQAFKNFDHVIKKFGNAVKKANGDVDLEVKLAEIINALMAVVDAEVKILQTDTEKIIKEISSVAGNDNRFLRKAKKHWDKALEKQEEGKHASHVVKEFMKAVKQANKTRWADSSE